MFDGPSVDRHHLVPRSEGGSEAVRMHRVCHTKIHSRFSERELATDFFTVERLQAHEDIAKFIRWVRKQDPLYVGRHRPINRT